MLVELFKKNPNIVINTDIDGILSGIVLCNYCNCRVVGFTNSKDTVWLADGYDDLYSNVYVDMFVTDNRVICVDQHIVAVNQLHQNKIISTGKKYSPQIDGNRDLTMYDAKYPFGTFQYIIAQLESEGISIKLPNLYSIVPNSTITIGDLLHRADDAMKTTMHAYVKNALYWWNWMLQLSNNSNSISELINYLTVAKSHIDQQVHNSKVRPKKADYINAYKEFVEDKKKNTKLFFKSNYNCSGSDGGFNRLVDTNGNMLPDIQNYIKAVSSLFNVSMNIPIHYNEHVGRYCRTRYLDIFDNDFINKYEIAGHKVFSYAFIYSPGADGNTNFSFTIDMK